MSKYCATYNVGTNVLEQCRPWDFAALPFEVKVWVDEQPAHGSTWDGEKFVPQAAPLPVTPTLDDLRKAKNDEINAERERRTFGSFEHQGKAVSCGTLSRSDIDGINGYVALNGAFPAIWPGVWKCADNTYLTISTIDEWKAFYGAMVAAGSALYVHAQELKAALAKATTAEEIADIKW